MKRTYILAGALLVGLICVICFDRGGFTGKQIAQRRRVELQKLEFIQAGVMKGIGLGGELPTNWISLSAMVKWEKAQNSLHLAFTNTYSVLLRPTVSTNYFISGKIFLIRSEPCAWPGRALGRWVLAGSSNQVLRFWLPEDDLPAEIRSQLTNQP